MSLLAKFLIGFLFLVTEVAALDYTWDNDVLAGIQGGDGDWSAASRWTGSDGAGTVLVSWPGAGNSATFGGADSVHSVTVTGTQSVQGLTFLNSGYVIRGGSLFLQPPALIRADSSAIISSRILGASGLIKSGLGTLSLLGGMLNTYTGATVVNEGRLILQDVDSLAKGTSTNSFEIAAGATLQLDANTRSIHLGSRTTGGIVISGSGTLEKSGLQPLYLGEQGSNGYLVQMNMSGGTIDIQEGTLRNGGWLGGVWTNNKASMNIAGGAIFDVWNGNPVFIDGLNGAGTVGMGINAGKKYLTLGVDNGSGVFTGTIVAGSSPIAIIKQGSGSQTLEGANTFSGGYTHQSGVTQVKHNTALGSGATIMNGSGQIVLGGGVQVANSLTVSSCAPGGGQGALQSNSGTATWAGPITLNAGCTNGGHFATSSAGGLVLSGAISAGAGVVVSQRYGSIIYQGGGSASAFSLVQGVAQLGANNGLPANSLWMQDHPVFSTSLNLFGFNQSFSSLQSEITTGSHVITNDQIGQSTLTLSGTQAMDTTYHGSITGNISLVKIGATRQSLDGVNSYLGPTQVNAGSLIVNGSLGVASLVSVASGATLGGTGSILGSVTLASGAALAPGDREIGTLRIGALAMNPNSRFKLELDSVGHSDSVVVSGNVTLDGFLDLANMGNMKPGTYTILLCSGILTNGGITLASVPQQFDYTVVVTGGVVTLQVKTASSFRQYWDLSSTLGVQTGSGTWGTQAIWSRDGVNLGAWPGKGFSSVFGALDGAYSIAVSGTPSVDSLIIDNSGYVLSGGTLGFSGALSAIICNRDVTISSQLQSTYALYKGGTGTLNLAPSSVLVQNVRTMELKSGTTNMSNGVYSLTGVNSVGNSLRVDGVWNFKSGSMSSIGTMAIGFASGAPVATISGGALSAPDLVLGWNSNSATTISGGSHVFTKDVWHRDAGVGVLSLNGGSLQTPKLGLSSDGAGIDGFTVNLNANSLLRTSNIYLKAGVAQGIHTLSLNLNGGKIEVGASGILLDAISGAGAGSAHFDAIVQAGGVTLDTRSFSTKILQSLTHHEPLVDSLDGGVIKEGSGTLILASDNSYTGPTQVRAGFLQVGDAKASGSIAGNILNDGQLTFNRSDTYTYGKVVSGSGSLVQLGSGTLRLSGVNIYSGSTEVRNGTLDVAGSVSSLSPVVVSNAATLGGSGTLGGSILVQNGGRLSPGLTKPTSMNLGSLTLSPTAVTEIDLGSVSDTLLVSGNATLGGMVEVTETAGLGEGIFTILKTAGKVTGSWVISKRPLGYLCSLWVDSNSVKISVSHYRVPSLSSLKFRAIDLESQRLVAFDVLEGDTLDVGVSMAIRVLGYYMDQAGNPVRFSILESPQESSVDTTGGRLVWEWVPQNPGVQKVKWAFSNLDGIKDTFEFLVRSSSHVLPSISLSSIVGRSASTQSGFVRNWVSDTLRIPRIERISFTVSTPDEFGSNTRVSMVKNPPGTSLYTYQNQLQVEWLVGDAKQGTFQFKVDDGLGNVASRDLFLLFVGDLWPRQLPKIPGSLEARVFIKGESAYLVNGSVP